MADSNNNHPDDEKQRRRGGGGFRALLQKISFSENSMEGDDTDKNDKNDDVALGRQQESAQQHTKATNSPSSKSRKLRRPLSFGHRKEAGLHGGAGVRWYHNLFPLNQKFEPRVEYPLWDEDWDSNQHHRQRLMADWAAGNPPSIVTRHIFLLRHGQYHENQKEDLKKTLTPLGRKQAKLTGQRIARMIHHHKSQNNQHSPIKTFAVSDLMRAKQTADIIYQELETLYREHNSHRPSDPELELSRSKSEPDPLLNEGFPVHHIPGPTGFRDLHCSDIDRDFPRAEEAFLKYIGTSNWLEERKDSQADESFKGTPPSNLTPKDLEKQLLDHRHDYEIIVGHANIMRYFICRALQIPPEAWLRLSLYHCSISYLVVASNGNVTARMIGDIGHIPYEETSVDSTNQGFDWE
ncbi:histidine phosphatase superfamily protein [Nitzschia inconspicua]|uniref:Serine/threonine-protein phosphatase PGAM5, mitochondrial n=1 Tax=Nitzschia inconspicua TaxID=303405 RepID=A0A9K3Q022_9STRA|nr:histidine phosphatase superfamily protein [Nitzschia inconspicua]